MKIIRHKKGSMVSWLLGYFLFNMLYTILIFSFIYDDVYIAQAANTELYDVDNESITSELTYAQVADIGFWTRFRLAVFDGIPWWLSMMFAGMNGIGLMILGYGALRGLT